MLAGASPYAFVFKKLLGSNSLSILATPCGKFEPTLSGLGIISSSGLLLLPAPNLSSNKPSGVT